MKKVVIFGIGEFAQVAHIYLSKDSPYEVAAFTVNEQYIDRKSLLGLGVVPFERLEETHPPDKFSIFVAVGFKKLNQIRAKIYNACKSKGYELISYVNSKALLWGEVKIGDNCFIFEANVIQPFVKIGNDVIIWSGNHIGRHAELGDHCFISSHVVISGGTKIGDYSFLGVNSTVGDSVTVAPRCLIGAGALIIHDTQEGCLYKAEETKPAGPPRKPIENL